MSQGAKKRNAINHAVVVALILSRDHAYGDPFFPVSKFTNIRDRKILAAAILHWSHFLGMWVQIEPGPEEDVTRGWMYVSVETACPGTRGRTRVSA